MYMPREQERHLANRAGKCSEFDEEGMERTSQWFDFI